MVHGVPHFHSANSPAIIGRAYRTSLIVLYREIFVGDGGGEGGEPILIPSSFEELVIEVVGGLLGAEEPDETVGGPSEEL